MSAFHEVEASHVPRPGSMHMIAAPSLYDTSHHKTQTGRWKAAIRKLAFIKHETRVKGRSYIFYR